MRLEEANEGKAKPKHKLPTIITGRIRYVPPVIGFVADLGVSLLSSALSAASLATGRRSRPRVKAIVCAAWRVCRVE